MDKLGSTYFFIIILIITICLFIIAVVNSVYYTDVNSKGSSTLSSTQLQQLIYLNIASAVLLFLCLFLVGYMMIVPNNKVKQIEVLKEAENEKREEFDNTIDDVENIRTDREKKLMTKQAMIELSSSLQIPLNKSRDENKKLKKEMDKLSRKVKIMSKEIDNLLLANNELENKHSDLLESNTMLEKRNNDLLENIDYIDKDYKLKLEILEQMKNKDSLFDEVEETISTDSLFDEQYNKNIIPISDLFNEEASLDEVLEEIPMSSVIDDTPKTFDYGLQVNRTTYSSYIPTQNTTPIALSSTMYKPFTTSFLKKK